MTIFETTTCAEELPSGARCNVIARVIGRSVMESTDGPIEHVQTKCFAEVSHVLYMPTAMLETQLNATYNAA
jgi:hypothetical protein